MSMVTIGLLSLEKVPRGTYIKILKVSKNPTGAFWKIQDDVQDGRRHIVKYNAGPTLNQHCFSVLCLLGCHFSKTLHINP